MRARDIETVERIVRLIEADTMAEDCERTERGNGRPRVSEPGGVQGAPPKS
jgi:hypothetical protein